MRQKYNSSSRNAGGFKNQHTNFKQGEKHKNKTKSHRLKILNLINKKIEKTMEK